MTNTLKVISYVTVILPLLALAIIACSSKPPFIAQHVWLNRTRSTQIRAASFFEAEPKEPLSNIARDPIVIGNKSFTYPYPAPSELHQNREAISNYIREFTGDNRVKALLERGLNNVEIIPFTELLSAVAGCVSALIQHLDGNEYIIGCVPKKSSHWLAQIALPHLSANMPKASCNHQVNSESDQCSNYDGFPTTPINRLVIFDDCSYSGSQLENIIHNCPREAELILAIPFMSVQAVNRVLKEAETSGLVSVTLITTSRRLKPVFNLYTQEEHRALHRSPETPISLVKLSCITLGEWKIPDNISVPAWLKVGLQEFTPCYK